MPAERAAEGLRGVEAVTLECRVNGRPVRRTVPTHRTLLDFLRDDLSLTGAKRACDVQVCGACTVLVDGLPVSACTYLAFEARGRSVETCEGLAEQGRLHPIQQAFVDAGALQCGFCTPGMVMAAKALFAERPHPTEDEIKTYLHGNLCRCTGYQKILDAIQAAARALTPEAEAVEAAGGDTAAGGGAAADGGTAADGRPGGAA